MVYKIPVKTKEEISSMRKGGAILASMLKELEKMAKPGLDVWELEKRFIAMCKAAKVTPACKNYSMSGFPPFPTGLCVSLNDQAVHCFPEKGKLLKPGDLLTIDTVIMYEGFYLDSAVSFGIGKLTNEKQKLLDTSKKALYESIKVIRPGIRIGNISHTMQNIVEKEGYSVLRQYAGHGIGKHMHELPEIPCYGNPEYGPTVLEGMTLAIEPLVCQKSYVLDHNNFWETKTVDGGNFVQVEHTVLVTKKGHEILTK